MDVCGASLTVTPNHNALVPHLYERVTAISYPSEGANTLDVGIARLSLLPPHQLTNRTSCQVSHMTT